MADGILKWANRVCRGHDHVTPPNDYEESWADGLCFCALFYAYFPEKIPIKTLTANTEADMIKNLTLAFKVGQDAGIESLLDPDDTLHVHEKKSIMLYLSEVYTVLKELPQKVHASAEWNKKYDAEEKTRKFAEWKAQKEAEARGEIYTPPKVSRIGTSAKATPEPAHTKTEEKTETPSSVSKNVSKRWDPRAAEEKEEKTPVKSVTVTETAPASSGSDSGVSYEIGGRGKEGGVEGRMLIFSVNFKVDGKMVMNPAKDDIGVHVECPGSTPRFNIMISNGAYHVGFTPSAGGQHWFDFTYKGVWANEPFCLSIKNKVNKVPDHPYTGASRGGAPQKSPRAATTAKQEPPKTATPAARKSGVVVEPCVNNSACSERTAEMTEEDYGSFKITSKNNAGEILKSDFKFDVKIDGPENIDSKITNNGDGTYKCTFGPAPAGDYRIEVSYKGRLIDKGAWDLRIVEAMTNMTIQELTILVQATDKYGKPKTVGGEAHKFKAISNNDSDQIEIEDEDDGRYTIIYKANPGLNTIDVKYEGESISGFPLSFEIPN
jgi:hypothetical protein